MSLFGKIGEFITGGTLGAVAKVADRFITSPDEKKQFIVDMYKLEMSEKANARDLYGEDSIMQKLYALVFLLAYLGLTGWLIYSIVEGSIKDINQFETGLIGSIWGGMSAKVNTITDFFFGSSEQKKDPLPSGKRSKN